MSGLESRDIDRRTFVKASSSLLLAKGVGARGEGTGAGALGELRLQLTGLHASAATGGSATATPQAGGSTMTIVIPASGDQRASVPVGTYTVSYTPPTNHLLAPAQTLPTTVTITEGQTTTVTIDLIASGSISVTVTGFPTTPSDAGSAVAQRTDASGSPVTINIATSGSGLASVPAGTYTVTYTQPSGFNVSTTNPLTGIVVGLGATAPAAFTVAPIAAAGGTVRVTVTGLTAASAGGSVSARLTNNTGSTFPLTLPTPTAGSTTGDITGVPAGQYNVTYTAPSGFQLASGQTNPAVVTVTSNNVSTANFVAQAAPTSALLFRSDWSTALGTTDTAIFDTSKTVPWNVRGGSGQEVVSAAGLDFPTTNVLRVTAIQAQGGYCLVRKTGLGVIPEGGSRWYRWYSRVVIPDGVGESDPETHPHQDGNAASQCSWLFHVYHQGLAGSGANQWTPQLRPLATTNAFEHARWTGPHLNKNQTYRFEIQITRMANATQFQMHVRIYDSANTLLHSDSGFRDNNAGTTTLANNPTLVLNGSGPGSTDGLNAGNNGLGGSDYGASAIYMYQGAVAVSSQDWIGPYTGNN